MPADFLHGVEFLMLTEGFRPIRVARSSVIGLVGTAGKGPVNTPVLVKSLREGLTTFGDSGTIPQALKDIFAQGSNVAMVIVVNAGPEATPDEIAGGVDPVTGKRTGIEALLDAEAVTGYKPRILIAPGFADDGDVRDALIAKAMGLRGIAILEVGQGKTPQEAIQEAQGLGSDRAILLYPYLLDGGVSKPPSAVYAGVISRTDNELGFWFSPSNKLAYGFDATEVPIDFGLGNKSSTANILNENRICTFVVYEGWRTWGNYTLSDDPQWKFITTRRILDIIADSIEMNIISFVDRPITRAFLEDLQDFEQAFLNSLIGRGALIDAKCYVLPENNPPEQIAAGHVVVDLALTPVYPAERIMHQVVIDIAPLVKLFA